MRKVAHAQKQNPLSDLDEILQDGRCPRRNMHLCQVWWRSVKGFGGGGKQVLPFPTDWSSSLQHTHYLGM